VDRIRVVLAEMPRMLRDIVQNMLGGVPDVALTTAPVRVDGLDEMLAALEPDVVILDEASSRGDDFAALLFAHPRLRLVAISGDGRDAHLYELRPHRVALGALSPTALIDVVRAPHATADRTARPRRDD
jgi:hypothetical protein